MSVPKKPSAGRTTKIVHNDSVKTTVPTYKIKTPPPKPKTGEK